MNRILFVDDEKFVLKVIEKKLEKTNIKIYLASTVHEAYEILSEKSIDVVIADIQMPGENGVNFLSKVKKLSPRTVRIIMSGYQRTASIIEAINDGHIYQFIPKPWKIDDAAISLLKDAINVSKKWQEDEGIQAIDIRDINKFTHMTHFVLTDTLNKLVYKNSDYPMLDSDLEKTYQRVRSTMGELRLYDLEGGRA